MTLGTDFVPESTVTNRGVNTGSWAQFVEQITECAQLFITPLPQVVRVATKEVLTDVLKWVKFSSVAWTHDNKGFFYQVRWVATVPVILTLFLNLLKCFHITRDILRWTPSLKAQRRPRCWTTRWAVYNEPIVCLLRLQCVYTTSLPHARASWQSVWCDYTPLL